MLVKKDFLTKFNYFKKWIKHFNKLGYRFRIYVDGYDYICDADNIFLCIELDNLRSGVIRAIEIYYVTSKGQEMSVKTFKFYKKK